MQDVPYRACDLRPRRSFRRISWRGVAAALSAVVPLLGAVGIVSARAGSPTIHYPGNQGWAPIYDGIPQSSPTRNHVIATLRNGTAVTITCTGTGTTQRSWWENQPTNWWDGIVVNGRQGYTSDAWVDTGTMGRANNRNCPGFSGTTGSSSGGATAAAAVARAYGQIGSYAWDWKCEGMVATDYQRPSWTSAIAQWNGTRSPRHYRDYSPPAGALLFFGANGSNGYMGHVAMATGNGTEMISNWSGHPVVKVNIAWEEYVAPYLGWVAGWDSAAWP